MKVKCNDCIITGKGTKDELIELGWMGVQSWIQISSKSSKRIYIKFELCPHHATSDRFTEVLKEKANQEGNLDKKTEVK